MSKKSAKSLKEKRAEKRAGTDIPGGDTTATKGR